MCSLHLTHPSAHKLGAVLVGSDFGGVKPREKVSWFPFFWGQSSSPSELFLEKLHAPDMYAYA